MPIYNVSVPEEHRTLLNLRVKYKITPGPIKIGTENPFHPKFQKSNSARQMSNLISVSNLNKF